MSGQFLIDFVAKSRFQHDSLTVPQKGIFPYISWKEFFVHTKKKKRSNCLAAGRHRIQHVNTLVPALIDRDAGLVQDSPEEFGPFFPGEVRSQRIQLL